jgi:hypothetical protein
MPTIVRWLGDFVRDVRLALRSLTRQASFTSLAVVTLALGVGANSAMFSIANPMLVQPLPYPDADRLLAVVPGTRENPSQATHVAYATFRDWQQATRSFAALGGINLDQSYWRVGGRDDRRHRQPFRGSRKPGRARSPPDGRR